jgi:CxxC-x17-CxxC domain-containing protein
MKNFNKGGRSFDRKGGFSRGGNAEHHIMHKAVCSECGKSCEVPFRPSGDKPVYCSDCFKSKDKSGSSRQYSRDFNKPSYLEKKMFKATCSQCGDSCEVPFRPTGEKPVLCSSCFGKDPRSADRKPVEVNSGRFDGQLKTINEKLDKILRMLNQTEIKKPVETVKPAIESAIKKKAKTKAGLKKKATKAKPKAKKKK